ncbi:MAG: hypothetical protein IT352_07580 [Gemmatimonadales bacterium]|nr:hypothetical protein [Gemmatimonadales bacterium]
MTGLTPALRRMATDRRLGPRAIRIYAYLADELDFQDYKPVKLLRLHRELRIDRADVSKTLRALCDHGYLDPGEREGSRGPRTYRLRYAVRRVEVGKSPTIQFARSA